MRKNYRPSLRARLTGLVLIAVLPAVGLILYHAGQQRITDSQETKREALRLVRVVASSQERLIDSTRHLLIALAMLREVRSQDKRACNALFARLLKEYPLYSNLGAADTSGEQFCSALPTTAPVSIGDRSYFQLALRRRALAIGEYQIGRVTRRPSVNLGYPVIDDAGSVTSVVFAAVDITALRDAAAMVNLPGYAALTIYDRHGTVLARTPEDSLVGKSIPEKHIFKMNLALGEGLTEAAGSDGKQWLFGFTSVRDRSNDPQMLMHIAIPSHIALAHSNGQLKRNLAALLLVTALALAAAWFGGDLFVFRQLRALIGTTERLRAGDLTARTRLPHEPNEIGRLAASFDSMADSLERNHRDAVATGKRLERNIQRLEALHEIDMALTSTLDLHAVLDLLLEKVDLILPGAVTTIRLISKETGALEPAACRNVSDAEWRAGNPRPMHGFAKIVLENKIPLTVANVQTDPRSEAHRFAHRFGLVSYLGIPLIAKNQPLGLIAFYTKEEHSFTDEEIEFLSTLAGQSAVAIQNAMLYEEARRSANELAALHSLTIAATKSLDLTETLREAINEITGMFHFDATRIFLFDSSMTELRVAAAFEQQPEFWAKLNSFQRGQGIVGRVAETGESLIFEDIKKDCRYLEFSHSKILTGTQTHFMAVLPIATKLKTWGVIVFVGKEPRRLRPNEVGLLGAMSNQIGIAVENATLYSQTAAKAKEVAGLYAIVGIASESLDLNTILTKVMIKVLEIFSFDAARIYLRDEESGGMHLVAYHGIPDGISLVTHYKAGQGQLGKALETGEAIFVEDMATDPTYNKLAHNKHLLRAGFRSSFLIPLKVRGEGLGVMHFVGREPHQFSENDVQLINAIAYHLGVAVGNARLFAKIERKTLELERASRGKDEFLGVISHELRTPLNVIKGYTEILMQGILGEISAEQRRALETISNQAMELFNMINGVLQVTKIEAGAVQAAVWEVDLTRLLDGLRRNYSIPFGKDLTVTWNMADDLPTIVTDDEKLKAILQNLLNNAIKFTETGTVNFSARRLLPGREIEFKVADSGIGIPKEEINGIFDMFRQVDSSATRKFGGVGLGLYIVKKYTELLGGRIAVESASGQGSTFTVYLPVNAAREDTLQLPGSQTAETATVTFSSANGS